MTVLVPGGNPRISTTAAFPARRRRPHAPIYEVSQRCRGQPLHAAGRRDRAESYPPVPGGVKRMLRPVTRFLGPGSVGCRHGWRAEYCLHYATRTGEERGMSDPVRQDIVSRAHTV